MPALQIEYSTIVNHVLSGLVAIALLESVTFVVRAIKRGRLERKYAIKGDYISIYQDKSGAVKAPVTLKQSGAKVVGNTFYGGRKWILRGEIKKEHLTGTYSPENLQDPGFGVFFLKIDRNCDMKGVWAGFDAEEKDVSSGEYRFLRKPPVAVTAIEKNQYVDILELAEKELGGGYINRSELQLAQGTSYSAMIDGRVVGFATAKILESRVFCERFEKFLGANSPDFRRLQQRLHGAEKVGLLASAATKPEMAGRGIGSALINRCALALAGHGLSTCVATAWKSTRGVQAATILESLGLHKVVEVSDYWKADSEQNSYRCPVCGDPPCHCAAVVYVGSISQKTKVY